MEVEVDVPNYGSDDGGDEVGEEEDYYEDESGYDQSGYMDNSGQYSGHNSMMENVPGVDIELTEDCKLFTCRFCHQVFVGPQSAADHARESHMIPGICY